jgi:hypothetical protein
MSYLAAGPIEDLINWHGAAVADELDVAMKREPKLRVALGSGIRLRAGVELDLPLELNLRDWYDGKPVAGSDEP